MPDPKPRPDDEHIEELLSQLQGIFGKLSQTDSEESLTKEDLPSAAQGEMSPKELAPPKVLPLAEKLPEVAPIELSPVPEPELLSEGSPSRFDPNRVTIDPLGLPPVAEETQPEAPAPSADTVSPFEEAPPEPVPEAIVETRVTKSPPEPATIINLGFPLEPMPPPGSIPAGVADIEGPMTEASVPDPFIEPTDASTGTGIFFPLGREAEASHLADKLESLSPKFTRIQFRLHVRWSFPYDPKSDWREAVLTKVRENRIRTLFILVDRSLEETRRKPLIAELDALKIYFHEVPLASISKNAFYTDLLLGLVFFFDSQRSPGS